MLLLPGSGPCQPHCLECPCLELQVFKSTLSSRPSTTPLQSSPYSTPLLHSCQIWGDLSPHTGCGLCFAHGPQQVPPVPPVSMCLTSHTSPPASVAGPRMTGQRMRLNINLLNEYMNECARWKRHRGIGNQGGGEVFLLPGFCWETLKANILRRPAQADGYSREKNSSPRDEASGGNGSLCPQSLL